MSVAYYSEIANVTREQVEHVTDFMSERIPEGGPDGAVFHADGPTDDDGWWAIDVYASDE